MEKLRLRSIKRVKQYLLKNGSHDTTAQETPGASPVVYLRLEDLPGGPLKYCLRILQIPPDEATTTSKCLFCESPITRACKERAGCQVPTPLESITIYSPGSLHYGIAEKCHDCALILGALYVSQITDTDLIRVRVYSEPGDTEVQVEIHLTRWVQY
jgi:hypothetical protein